MTSKVLNRKIPMWRGQTILEIVEYLQLKPCIVHDAVQHALLKQWQGEVYR